VRILLATQVGHHALYPFGIEVVDGTSDFDVVLTEDPLALLVAGVNRLELYFGSRIIFHDL